MPRDYAKQRVLQPSARKKKRGRAIMAFVVTGVIAVTAVGLFWIIQNHAKLKNDSLSKIKTLIVHKKDSPPSEKKVTPPLQEEVHFDFYTELPSMQVSPVAIATPQESPAKKLQSPSETGAYIIQVGVYENENTASETRLSLLLSELETEVVAFEEQGKKYYRVQLGGFADASSAKIMQKRFQNKGFDSVIKKL